MKNGGCDELVTCTDDGAGGSICGARPAGYDGDGTSGCVDHDACVDNPCAAGVHCEDDKPPLMTRTCGKCPAGQVGDGETCREPLFRQERRVRSPKNVYGGRVVGRRGVRRLPLWVRTQRRVVRQQGWMREYSPATPA